MEFVEQEQQRAEQERQRTEQERQRAEQLADYLRSVCSSALLLQGLESHIVETLHATSLQRRSNQTIMLQ